ncbi:MAG: hypothetical protein KJO31_13505, partial [Gammaproteobacteria bacterium]|nr:hypothetical protein [Gammaproteobacteria bacterium]
MHKGLSHIPVLLMTLAILTCHGSELSREITDEQWKADLQQISASIKEIHFKPFHVLPEAEFDAAVQDLGERIPELSDTEIVVAMAQLIAKLRDGHTRIHMPRQYPEFALLSELGHSGTPPPKFRALELRSAPVRFG